MIKKNLVLGALTAAFMAVSSVPAQAAPLRVGIALPTQNDHAWYVAGPLLKRALEGKGYGVDLYYGGDNDVPIQKRQMGRMIEQDGDKVLLVAPISANELIHELKPAKKAGIPVISYDRLVMNSDSCQYYVGFDSGAAGRMQAQAIIKALDLDNRTGAPAKIELFGGDAKDRTAEIMFNNFLGQMLDYTNGKVEIPSGNMFLVMCATPGWSTDAALKRMDQIIADQGLSPDGNRLDAIYCANDSIANGVIMALKKAGFTAENMPYITGMDATIDAVKGILNGERGSTIYKDPSALIDNAIKMIDSLLSGKEPEINDTDTFNNGLYMMKSSLCEPVFVDKTNVKKVLLDSGVFTEEELRD